MIAPKVERSSLRSIKRSISTYSEGQRSDTDSGRSSDVETRKIISNKAAPKPLKVVHEKPHSPMRFNSLPRRHETIGLVDQLSPVKDTHTKKHPIVRRINEANRKRDSRRNTIDITSRDLQMAEALLQKSESLKSSNQNIGISPGGLLNESFSNGVSLPDLSVPKLYVLPTLKVRRYKSVREDVHKIMPPTKNDEENDVISKGPEFIVNSSLPVKQLDLTEPKVKSIFLTQKLMLIFLSFFLVYSRHIKGIFMFYFWMEAGFKSNATPLHQRLDTFSRPF